MGGGTSLYGSHSIRSLGEGGGPLWEATCGTTEVHSQRQCRERTKHLGGHPGPAERGGAGARGRESVDSTPALQRECPQGGKRIWKWAQHTDCSLLLRARASCPPHKKIGAPAIDT